MKRYSSRRASLQGFLPGLLPGALAYDRIAGYFSSSLLDVAGEALQAMAPGAVARIVCNSTLDERDIMVARAQTHAWRQEMTPPDLPPLARERLGLLHALLTSGRLKVKVLPDPVFGLVHGKAGVITRHGGSRVAFVGSANETRRAWRDNYEILWSDESDEAADWVQEEFDALWRHPLAFNLEDGVIADIERLSKRVVLSMPAWAAAPEQAPAAASAELPVSLESGLWPHQKAFVRRAFAAHQNLGARYILADQVGLGKTLQLALAAKLMALQDGGATPPEAPGGAGTLNARRGGGRVLILAPKTLLEQWQAELWTLLRFPTAVWTGDGWRDEQGIEYPASRLDACPRRAAIVSSGLVTASQDAAARLLRLEYSCVILDEAHRARRKNLSASKDRDVDADPNKLLAFLRQVAPRARSVLLGTATPVQLDAIEAYDLLAALNAPQDGLPCKPGTGLTLGTGPWLREPRAGLRLVTDPDAPRELLSQQDGGWEWLRNPFPPPDESRDLRDLRRALGLHDDNTYAEPFNYYKDHLNGPAKSAANRVLGVFAAASNPYIRHIVRRTRRQLEETSDPITGEPLLKPVGVDLFGETPQDALTLPAYLRDAYAAAEEFTRLLGQRPGLSSGFLKTLLLRRMGSSVYAGFTTASKMLRLAGVNPNSVPGDGQGALFDEDDDDAEIEAPAGAKGRLYPLRPVEIEALRVFQACLHQNNEEDPKLELTRRLLRDGLNTGLGGWLQQGCIIFSQYLDTAEWVAGQLAREWPDEPIGLYAGSGRSRLYANGVTQPAARDDLKTQVRDGRLRLLIGTDAASEGLNLQRLGALINLDLPWNPTRLEQRKGRIQRIGQSRPRVSIFNARYKDSVEDRVHDLLSERLKGIHDLFGQLPDTLEDVWVDVALRDEADARRVIDEVPRQHPFLLRNEGEPVVSHDDWESAPAVLDPQEQLQALLKGW